MKMAEFLGKPASSVLNAEPFKYWTVERWVDDDANPPEIGYTFKGCGLQLGCDRDHEIVHSVFLEAEEHAGDVLSEIPFGESRDQVRACFGSPSRSGESMSHPILGKFGPWDRFDMSKYTVHVEYKHASDTIRRITLMRNDVAP